MNIRAVDTMDDLHKEQSDWQKQWQQQWQVIWQKIHANHHHDALTDSTNTQLMTALTQGRLDPSRPHLWTADEQSAGRGQHGRSWVSGVGNVFLSLYVPMSTAADGFGLHRLSGLLSLSVGLTLSQLPIINAINDARVRSGLGKVGVKWANDVGYYDDTRHLFQKLAGILIEPVYVRRDDKTGLAGVITGIGLNVKSSPLIKDGLYQATCLQDLCDAAAIADVPTAHALYQPMCQAVCQAIQWQNQLDDEHARLDFVDVFNQAHILTGKEIKVYARDEMQVVAQAGRCVGIDDQGALLLENAGSIERVFAGMIQSA